MMPNVTIDGREYDLESLPEEAKKQLAMIQLVDRKLADLQGEMAIHNAARSFYAKNLAVALKKTPDDASSKQD